MHLNNVDKLVSCVVSGCNELQRAARLKNKIAAHLQEQYRQNPHNIVAANTHSLFGREKKTHSADSDAL